MFRLSTSAGDGSTAPGGSGASLGEEGLGKGGLLAALGGGKGGGSSMLVPAGGAGGGGGGGGEGNDDDVTLHGAAVGKQGITQRGLARIIENPTGRRLKVVDMGGKDLYDLFEGKLFVMGLFSSLLRGRKSKDRTAKLYATGLFRMLRRKRRDRELSAKGEFWGLQTLRPRLATAETDRCPNATKQNQSSPWESFPSCSTSRKYQPSRRVHRGQRLAWACLGSEA